MSIVIPVNQQYGLVFNGNQDQLRVAMNRALATMKRNGEYQRLINRWGLQPLLP
jgi:ABC-type amino acid transport substrate-binding protein